MPRRILICANRSGKHLLTTLGLLLLLIGLTGCGSSGAQRVMDGYEDASTGASSVMVLPLGSHLAKSQNGTQAVTPSGRAEESFYTYFGSIFDEATASLVQQASADFAPEDLSLVYRSFPLDDEEDLTILAPEGGQLATDNGTPLDFLLFVEDLNFTTDVETGKIQYAGNTQGQMLLKGSLKYVLWDNQAQQVAAYGRVKGQTATTPALPSKHYQQIFQQLSEEIIRSVPLAPPMKSVS